MSSNRLDLLGAASTQNRVFKHNATVFSSRAKPIKGHTRDPACLVDLESKDAVDNIGWQAGRIELGPVGDAVGDAELYKSAAGHGDPLTRHTVVASASPWAQPSQRDSSIGAAASRYRVGLNTAVEPLPPTMSDNLFRDSRVVAASRVPWSTAAAILPRPPARTPDRVYQEGSITYAAEIEHSIMVPKLTIKHDAASYGQAMTSLRDESSHESTSHRDDSRSVASDAVLEVYDALKDIDLPGPVSYARPSPLARTRAAQPASRPAAQGATILPAQLSARRRPDSGGQRRALVSSQLAGSGALGTGGAAHDAYASVAQSGRVPDNASLLGRLVDALADIRKKEPRIAAGIMRPFYGDSARGEVTQALPGDGVVLNPGKRFTDRNGQEYVSVVGDRGGGYIPVDHVASQPEPAHERPARHRDSSVSRRDDGPRTPRPDTLESLPPVDRRPRSAGRAALSVRFSDSPSEQLFAGEPLGPSIALTSPLQLDAALGSRSRLAGSQASFGPTESPTRHKGYSASRGYVPLDQELAARASGSIDGFVPSADGALPQPGPPARTPQRERVVDTGASFNEYGVFVSPQNAHSVQAVVDAVSHVVPQLRSALSPSPGEAGGFMMAQRNGGGGGGGAAPAFGAGSDGGGAPLVDSALESFKTAAVQAALAPSGSFAARHAREQMTASATALLSFPQGAASDEDSFVDDGTGRGDGDDLAPAQSYLGSRGLDGASAGSPGIGLHISASRRRSGGSAQSPLLLRAHGNMPRGGMDAGDVPQTPAEVVLDAITEIFAAPSNEDAANNAESSEALSSPGPLIAPVEPLWSASEPGSGSPPWAGSGESQHTSASSSRAGGYGVTLPAASSISSGSAAFSELRFTDDGDGTGEATLPQDLVRPGFTLRLGHAAPSAVFSQGPDGIRVKHTRMTGSDLLLLARGRMQALGCFARAAKLCFAERRAVKLCTLGILASAPRHRAQAKVAAELFGLGLPQAMLRERGREEERARSHAAAAVAHAHGLVYAASLGRSPSKDASAVAAAPSAGPKLPEWEGPRLKALHYDGLNSSSARGTVFERALLSPVASLRGAHGSSEQTTSPRHDDILAPLLRGLNVFAAAPAGAGRNPVSSPLPFGSPGAKAAEARVQLLDSKLSQNAGIALMSFFGRDEKTVSLAAAKAALMAFDVDALVPPKAWAPLPAGATADQLKEREDALAAERLARGDRLHLLVQVPELYDEATKRTVASSAVETPKLDLPERFVRELVLGVPHVKRRIEFLEASLTLGDVAARLNANLCVFASAIAEVRNAPSLERLLVEVILTIVNSINTGAKKGTSYGYRMSGLRSLMAQKAPGDASMTLLRFIVKGLYDSNSPSAQEMLELPACFPTLLMVRNRPALVNMPALETALNVIASATAAGEALMRHAQQTNDGTLALRLMPLLDQAKAALAQGRERLSNVTAAFKETCSWFGEDPAATAPEAFFRYIGDFMADFAAEVKGHRDRVAAAERKVKAALAAERAAAVRATPARSGMAKLGSPAPAAAGGRSGVVRTAVVSPDLLSAGKGRLRRGNRRSLKLDPLSPGDFKRMLAEAAPTAGITPAAASMAAAVQPDAFDSDSEDGDEAAFESAGSDEGGGITTQDVVRFIRESRAERFAVKKMLPATPRAGVGGTASSGEGSGEAAGFLARHGHSVSLEGLAVEAALATAEQRGAYGLQRMGTLGDVMDLARNVGLEAAIQRSHVPSRSSRTADISSPQAGTLRGTDEDDGELGARSMNIFSLSQRVQQRLAQDLEHAVPSPDAVPSTRSSSLLHTIGTTSPESAAARGGRVHYAPTLAKLPSSRPSSASYAGGLHSVHGSGAAPSASSTAYSASSAYLSSPMPASTGRGSARDAGAASPWPSAAPVLAAAPAGRSATAAGSGGATSAYLSRSAASAPPNPSLHASNSYLTSDPASGNAAPATLRAPSTFDPWAPMIPLPIAGGLLPEAAEPPRRLQQRSR